MKRNIFLILVSFVFGILSFIYLKVSLDFKIFIFLSFFFSIFLSFYFNLEKKIKVFLLLFFLGFFVMSFQKLDSNLNLDEKTNLKVVVISSWNSKNFKNYIAEIFEKDGEKVKEKTYLSTNLDFEIGDILEVYGDLKEIKENTNPNLFNYKFYYANKKIFSKIFSNDIKKIGKSSDLFLNLKKSFQKFVENTFDNTLSLKNSNILKKIFLAKSYDFDFEKDVREIGLSHILAVSGLHIGIIYFILVFIFKIFLVDRALREFFSIFLIVLYAILIDNPSSVVRALVYILVIRYTKFTFKIVDNLNSLLLCVFLILLFKPLFLFDLGFNLSFLSSLAIILLLPKISKRKDSFLISSLKLTFVIFLLTFSFILKSFGEISLITFLGNLILVPFFIIAIILGFSLLFFALIFLKISLFIGFFVDLLLDLIRINIEFLNHFNFKIYFYNFNIFFVILVYFLIYIYFSQIYRKMSLENLKIFLIAITISTIFVNFYNYNRNLVKINFIDIGQGDSILVRTNKENILIDTGGDVNSNFNSKNILLSYLKKSGVKNIDYVFISHLDKDHCGNLNFLSENIKIKNLILRKNAYKEYVRKYGDGNFENILEVSESEKIKLSKINFDIFYFKNEFFENENSLILRLNANGRKILFTGDIGFSTENKLLDKDIKSDFLKVSHHGSKNSTSTEFLKKVDAKISVISVSKNNSYNHPNKETLDRLKNENIEIFRTDKDGNVILEIDKNSYKIVSFIKLKENIFEIFKFYFYDIFFIALFLLSFLILILLYKKQKEKEEILF